MTAIPVRSYRERTRMSWSRLFVAICIFRRFNNVIIRCGQWRLSRLALSYTDDNRLSSTRLRRSNVRCLRCPGQKSRLCGSVLQQRVLQPRVQSLNLVQIEKRVFTEPSV